MARQPQRRSPGFVLTPAPPLELVRKGIETAEADLVARLTRQKEIDAKSAGLKREVAQAELEIMRKGGMDIEALARKARELPQQLGGALKQPLPKLPGLQPQIPPGPVGHSFVMPPYSWDWSSTGYLEYAPGTLSARADRETGTLGFEDVPDGTSDQADASYAAAAVGIYFKPEVAGVVAVTTTAPITEQFGYAATYYTGCNVRGWVGFLVQAYDASNSLVETLVYQQNILFDEGSDGRSFYANDAQFQSLNEMITVLGFYVTPKYWYAIWLWCGGDIHSDGFMPSFPAKGSYAEESMDVSVPYFSLHYL